MPVGKPYRFQSQGYNKRLDESLGIRDGKRKQSYQARRAESKGTSKAMGGRAYGALRTSR